MKRETIAQVRERLTKAAPEELPSLVSEYAEDDRAGVRELAEAAIRRADAHKDELERLQRLDVLQRTLHEQGYTMLAGVDEVGRGALAGPVTAAAVILPVNSAIEGIDDSKKLSPETRSLLDAEIREKAECVSVAHIAPTVIDELGIAGATLQAMSAALDGLSLRPDHVIVDGLPVELDFPSTAVVGGDASVSAIAAASIVAKVARDRLMVEFDAEYPGWGFTINKGYGTAPHMEAIRAQGISPLHRRSFAPCVDQGSLF